MNDMMNEEECSPMAIMASKKISIAKPMNELDNYYKILNDYVEHLKETMISNPQARKDIEIIVTDLDALRVADKNKPSGDTISLLSPLSKKIIESNSDEMSDKEEMSPMDSLNSLKK